MSFSFREYRTHDKGKIQDNLINKKRLDKYTLKTLKYNVASFLGLYRPYIYLLEDVEQNKIVGMAVLVNRIDYSFSRMEWWIESVIVDAEKRKSGLGTMLLNHLCDVLRVKGAKKAFLNFESENVIAKSFYKKLGLIPSKRIFTMNKKPFSALSLPYKFSTLVPVKHKKKRDMLLRAFIPLEQPLDNRGIGFCIKMLTFLRLLVIDVAQGMTTKGQMRSIAVIYFYFMARVEIILPDMLDAAELEQIISSEFSKFSLCAWRKIILSVICKGPNCDQRPCPQTLPKVCNIEDFVEFELSQI